MLLVGRVVQPHSDEDEEDQQWPDDLDQELKLRDRQEETGTISRDTHNTTQHTETQLTHSHTHRLI